MPRPVLDVVAIGDGIEHSINARLDFLHLPSRRILAGIPARALSGYGIPDLMGYAVDDSVRPLLGGLPVDDVIGGELSAHRPAAYSSGSSTSGQVSNVVAM